MWLTLERNQRVLPLRGLLPCLAGHGGQSSPTQEIINPTQALPSQEARLALVIKRSYPHEHPVPSVEDSTLLLSASTSTSISCDNLQTEDQLASPPPYPHPGFCSTPALPRPPQGPSCRRPRQSVIPLALLSALGRSGQIKPLSHIPRKAQGQMGQDKWCQIIDLLLAWTQERAPVTALHMAVGGEKGAQSRGSNTEER